VNVVRHHHIRQVVTVTLIGTHFEFVSDNVRKSGVYEKPLPVNAAGRNEVYSSCLGVTAFAKISAMRGSIAHKIQFASYCKYWHEANQAGLFRFVRRRG